MCRRHRFFSVSPAERRSEFYSLCESRARGNSTPAVTHGADSAPGEPLIPPPPVTAAQDRSDQGCPHGFTSGSSLIRLRPAEGLWYRTDLDFHSVDDVIMLPVSLFSGYLQALMNYWTGPTEHKSRGSKGQGAPAGPEPLFEVRVNISCGTLYKTTLKRYKTNTNIQQ